MKTILHPDYWVEIPAGEYGTGLPPDQENLLRDYLYQWAGYQALSALDKQTVDNAVSKHREYAVASLQMDHFESVRNKPDWTPEQKTIVEANQRLPFLINMEGRLARVPFLSYDTQPKIKKRFYMMRFPVNRYQTRSVPTKKGAEAMPVAQIPGSLEGPVDMSRDVEAISAKYARRFCRHLGGRLPTTEEWEKAGRGTDGRLYPWGNVWDPEAGDFYYGQPTWETRRIDAYPRGMSPYGVWAMAGGISELVKKGPRRGTHARESSAEMAWLDHMFGFEKGGRWVSFRPVLTDWPEQTLTGFQAGLTVPNAEALQKMGPLADTLLTQYRWNDLETKILDALEPAIVALREARKQEAKERTARLLADPKTQIEATWLLLAAATENIPKQRAYVKRAMALKPDGEVGWKLAKLLEEPARVRW